MVFKSKIKSNYIDEMIKSSIYKISNIIISFLLIPQILNKMGNKDYGVWITIGSIISWLSISDLGIGNSLRNIISYNYENNNKYVYQIVSETFKILSKISFGLFFLFFLLISIFDFRKIFKEFQGASKEEFKLFLFIIFTNFIINFIFGMYRSIALGLRKSYLIEISSLCSNILIMALVFFFKKVTLLDLGFINLISVILGNSITFLGIVKKDKKFIPYLKKRTLKYSDEIFKTGNQFFILQICGVILFSTDNFIISKILGAEDATQYSILNKIFESGIIIYSMMMVPLWSHTAKAYAENKFSLINDYKNKLIKICIIFISGTIMVSLVANDILKIWLGSDFFIVNKRTLIIFCAYNSLVYYNAIYVNLANGFSILKIQVVVSIIAAILNIPLSIYFAINLNMGIGGVKLATFTCILIGFVIIRFKVEQKIKGGMKL